MPNILIVDDSEDITKLVELKLSDYTCYVANSPDVAVAMAEEIDADFGGLDLIISDYHLDHVDGLQMKQEIDASLGRKVKGVLLSGYDSRRISFEDLYAVAIDKNIEGYNMLKPVVKALLEKK